MAIFRNRRVDLNIKLWELGIREVPPAIIPFINQSKDRDGAEFQIRLVGSSGFAALGEPVRILDFLFNLDDGIKRKFLSRSTNILDHGCGVGRFSVVFRAYGKHQERMLGVDVLDDCAKNYREIVMANAESVLNQQIADWVGPDYFDSTISYSVFTHLPLNKAIVTLSDLHSVTKMGGVLVLTIWNERLLSYLKSYNHSSSNGFWWENLKQTIGKYSTEDLNEAGCLFAPNSGGDGLPADVYGDTVYSESFFEKTASEIGWVIRRIVNEDSLSLQTIVILEKNDRK
jgi:2-polyprenyl-3-methyl-5-hydroxy-6-metoxy-1,4-benzoquinol methylase